MKEKPYLLFGLLSRPWTTYSIEAGVAYVRTWPRGKISIPLADAKFEAPNSLLNFGSITISSGGESIEWTRVKRRSQVLEMLERARAGLPLHGQIEQTPRDERKPPEGVVFGCKLIKVQPVPSYFFAPLYEFTFNHLAFSTTSLSASPQEAVGRWVQKGEILRTWRFPTHPDGCIWCTIGAHEVVEFRFRSPVSGLVLHAGSAISTSDYPESPVVIVLLPEGDEVINSHDSSLDDFVMAADQCGKELFRS